MANRAAWQKTLKGHPLALEPAPMPSPRPDQIVVRARAIGINPADAAVQRLGLIYAAAQHPLVLGLDVAGYVHAVGSSVTSFKVGDRVCAHAVDIPTPESASSHSPRGAFQLFCAVSAGLAARIPDAVAFADAAVFPSCLSVAAYSLFLPHALALSLPPLGGAVAPNGAVVVIWGGSSVVGSCAIQLARQAGYSVVATSSELNFEHCRSLGAEAVFDYRDPSVVEDVVAACGGRECAGVFAAYYNDGSTVACSQIASRLEGSKVVATVVPPSMPVPADVAEGVRIASNWAPAIADTDEGAYIWRKWFPSALKDGSWELLPRPEVAGKCLEALQGAVDTMFGRLHMLAPQAEQQKSISPRKLVVEID